MSTRPANCRRYFLAPSFIDVLEVILLPPSRSPRISMLLAALWLTVPRDEWAELRGEGKVMVYGRGEEICCCCCRNAFVVHISHRSITSCLSSLLSLQFIIGGASSSSSSSSIAVVISAALGQRARAVGLTAWSSGRRVLHLKSLIGSRAPLTFSYSPYLRNIAIPPRQTSKPAPSVCRHENTGRSSVRHVTCRTCAVLWRKIYRQPGEPFLSTVSCLANCSFCCFVDHYIKPSSPVFCLGFYYHLLHGYYFCLRCVTFDLKI